MIAAPPPRSVQARPTGLTSSGAPASQAPSAERKSIAVLPFTNLTGDAAKEYFSDGMADELIHTMARIPGLEVPSRTSSSSYKGCNVNVRQIARDLGVNMVLEGSVRSAGGCIRVTAQFVNAESGFHISWHVMSGTRLQELMELGGWKWFEMVLRYAHLAPEHWRAQPNESNELGKSSRQTLRFPTPSLIVRTRECKYLMI